MERFAEVTFSERGNLRYELQLTTVTNYFIKIRIVLKYIRREESWLVCGASMALLWGSVLLFPVFYLFWHRTENKIFYPRLTQVPTT